MVEVERKYRMLMSSFLLVFSIFSCQQKIENNKQINNIESIGKTQKQVEGFQPEISINKLLYLRDDMSVRKFYQHSKNLINVDRVRETPVIIFSDKTSDEYLIAYQYEGDTENTFSLFEIGYFKDDGKLKNYTINNTDYENFTTESGLKLGMPLNDVINLKGKGYKIEKNSIGKILKYKIDDLGNPTIEKYGMPPYFMDFYFENDKVYKIIFGFEYP